MYQVVHWFDAVQRTKSVVMCLFICTMECIFLPFDWREASDGKVNEYTRSSIATVKPYVLLVLIAVSLLLDR